MTRKLMEDAAVILLLKANCPPWHMKWFYEPSTPHRKFLENLASAPPQYREQRQATPPPRVL